MINLKDNLFSLLTLSWSLTTCAFILSNVHILWIVGQKEVEVKAWRICFLAITVLTFISEITGRSCSCSWEYFGSFAWIGAIKGIVGLSSSQRTVVATLFDEHHGQTGWSVLQPFYAFCSAVNATGCCSLEKQADTGWALRLIPGGVSDILELLEAAVAQCPLQFTCRVFWDARFTMCTIYLTLENTDATFSLH